MAKLDACDRCHFCAHSPYVVCAVHPEGVEGDHCKDFRLALWASLVAEGGQSAEDIDCEMLIFDPVNLRSLDQQIQRLDGHPLVKGGMLRVVG